MKKKTLTWLQNYIDGEITEPSAEILKDLEQIATRNNLTVYRGVSYDQKQSFFSRYPTAQEGESTFTYKSSQVRSWSHDYEQAEMFATSMYGNYGLVMELQTENLLHIDLKCLPSEMTQEMSHENEVLILEPINHKVKIKKIFSGIKDRLGMKD